jgi:hypothetical protein
VVVEKEGRNRTTRQTVTRRRRELQLTPETCHVPPYTLMLHSVALDESAIIQNLDTNIDIAFPFTSAQPTSHSDGNSIHLFFPTSNNKLPLPIIEDALPDIQISAPHSEPHSNRQATGMLNLLRAEDAYVRCLTLVLTTIPCSLTSVTTLVINCFGRHHLHFFQ